jgi:hypothetical protein
MEVPQVVRVLRSFAAQQVDAHAVLRAVVEHDDWFVPAAYASRALGRARLERAALFGTDIRHPPNTLLVYSDGEIAAFAHGRGLALGPYEAGISGTELFSGIQEGLTAIVVNEGAAQADKLYLQGPGFGNAPAWAIAVAFESLLALPPSAELVEAVRQYDAYFAALHAHDGSIVTLQNYPGLRNAGLLFTAPDCLDAFMHAVGASAEGLTTGQTTGARVFDMLPDLGIDGVVINPSGPGMTRPFTIHELLG